LNYTKNDNGTVNTSDNFGGATPLSAANVFPGITVPTYYNFFANLLFGTNPLVNLAAQRFTLHQWNVTDSMTSVFGSHTLKYGIDYRRQTGTNGQDALINGFFYSAAGDLTANSAPEGFVFTFGNPPTGLFTNFSAFAQDEWKATNRLHVSFGLRWDYNPPPTTSTYPKPYTLNQITDFTTAQLAPQGTPMWHTDYRGFAPRVGVAYQLHQTAGHETVLRSGFGVFYDVGNYNALYGLLGGVGIGSQVFYFGVPFPYTPAQQVLPPPSITPPYGPIEAADPYLKLPYTLQWNTAIEQGLGKNQTLTLSYVGSGGRKLLHTSVVVPGGNFGSTVSLLENGATSSYNSLQVQFQRRLMQGLQALASYTWSHAIDDLSSNQNAYEPLLRGNADFDARHNFSAALTYDVPFNHGDPFVGTLLKHWAVDLRQSALSAPPVDVYTGTNILPNGQEIYFRPNLIPGVPVYLSDSTAPGGRVINFNAFATPPGNENGDEPRNFLRGFNAWQTDFGIRREFPIHERLNLQFRGEFFNLFNHPNFGGIDNLLSDGPTLFGRATGTLNNTLGGLNPLYQMGGPRSVQLALKLQF
jgi:hypothetical protein